MKTSATGRQRGGARDGGIALVIVLWLVALLGLLAVGQTAAVRTETQVTGNQLESAQARVAAYGGIQLGLLDLMRPPQSRTWAVDGTNYQTTLNDVTLSIRLVDEAGKVDLNFATGPLLDKLLRVAGVDDADRQPLVDAILDWRDPDQLRRAEGAEAAEYQSAGLSYGPPNEPFQTTAELSLVRGMTPTIYYAIADSITVYSGSASFNPALVSGRVMQLMLQEGMTENSEEDGDVDSPSAPVANASHGGQVFTIHSSAQMPSGVREHFTAVVRLTPSRGVNAPLHEVLAWREGETGTSAAVGDCKAELGC